MLAQTLFKDINRGEISQSLEEEINKYIDEFLISLKSGESGKSFFCYYLDNTNKNSGIKVPLNSHNLISDLYEVFKVNKKLIEELDETLLKSLCEKHHVSYDYCCLNTETEEVLQINGLKV